MKNNPEVASYIALRRIVGLLGVALPIIVAVWGFFLLHHITILSSISEYYTLRTRDAFVGILFAIGWFLFSYKGYGRQDDIAGTLGGICALLVAVFPIESTVWEGNIHMWASIGLFLILSYFSLVLFTKTNGNITPQKIIRNRIYKTCGIIMLTGIILLILTKYFLNAAITSKLHPIFWLETVILFSLGFSWFVKGELMFCDSENV